MHLVISIEGAKANSEQNVIGKLAKLLSLHYNQDWFYVPLNVRSENKQDYVIPRLNETMQLETGSNTWIEEVEAIFIVHDGDTLNQNRAQQVTITTIKNEFKNKNPQAIVKTIKFKNEIGHKKNNIENELLCKLDRKIIVPQDFQTHYKIDLALVKKQSSKNFLVNVAKEINLELYNKDDFEKLLTNLCTNQTAYCFIFKHFLKNSNFN